METKDIKSIIIKWELTGDGYNNTAKDGEDLGFIVGRYFGGDRSCAITADIQITTEDTTFILDIKIESIITFTNDTTPTPENIYDLYKEARLKWRNEILKRCQIDSLPLIVIDSRYTPFAHLKDSIEKALRKSFVQDN